MLEVVINFITARKITPVRAIRAKCLDCSNGVYAEATNCVVSQCPLYPYRKGKKPTAEELEGYVKSLATAGNGKRGL